MQMPTSGGGLMRYNDEYDSRFKLKPAHVIVFIVAVIALTLFLKIFIKLPVA